MPTVDEYLGRAKTFLESARTNVKYASEETSHRDECNWLRRLLSEIDTLILDFP